MEDIYESIVETFNEGMHIPLILNGNFNVYIGISNTTINGVLFPNAIHYRISDNSTKRITSQFIELTYQYFLQNDDYPNRNWYLEHPELNYEYASRKCNYSVAQGLINTVIENN